MKKNIIAGMIAVVFIVTAASAAPASALSIDELQAQIKELLAKVATLQAQLQTAVGSQIPAIDPTTITDAMKPGAHRICSILARNLSHGAQGDDVRGLQEFLSSEGYLSANATGYFGSLTAQAVAKWQESQGVSAVGILGPMSRERIKMWCGGGQGNTERFNAAPQNGQAPLTVRFKYNPIGFDNTIDFGDGASQSVKCSRFKADTDACLEYPVVEHTYTKDGAYEARLIAKTYLAVDDGRPAEQNKALGSVRIVVGQATCTKEYSPVCGSKPIVCITTPCNLIPQTYGNRCTMNADGATFLYEGQCRTQTDDTVNDPQCKIWREDCGRTWERDVPGGPVRNISSESCGPAQNPKPKPYCKAWFDNSGNKPPTISSFSGPTTLAVNASGTWTIQASDPENQPLKYSIVWGDEFQGLPAFMSTATRDVYVQATTFTHSYAQAGTYTVIIVVSDASGAVAKTTSTIRVGASEPVACTMEYAPVCGQKIHACLSFNPPSVCTLMELPAYLSEYKPKTYSNRCMMNADGATFLYSGECRI